MDNKKGQISNFNFQIIDNPKLNFLDVDFDNDNENNLNYYGKEFDFNYNFNNDNDNIKLNRIKKNIKALKTEIKKLNYLAHKGQETQNVLNHKQNTIDLNNNFFDSKNKNYRKNKNNIMNNKIDYYLYSNIFFS